MGESDSSTADSDALANCNANTACGRVGVAQPDRGGLADVRLSYSESHAIVKTGKLAARLARFTINRGRRGVFLGGMSSANPSCRLRPEYCRRVTRGVAELRPPAFHQTFLTPAPFRA